MLALKDLNRVRKSDREGLWEMSPCPSGGPRWVGRMEEEEDLR
jgi:hypothetical protein